MGRSTAKRLIEELQLAIDANGGDDLWVGLVDMDEGEKYGHAEMLSVYTSEEAPVFGMPTVVITYN